MFKHLQGLFDKQPVTRLETYGETDVGRIRDHNEDDFFVGESQRVYAVADGMGGGECGEIASRCVIQALEGIPTLPVNPVREVRSAIERANTHLVGMADHLELEGMGSTVVCVCTPPLPTDKAVILHAGDSRIYRLRGKSFRPLTKDHSLEQEFKDQHEKMPAQYKSVITRAVGVRTGLLLEETRIDLRPNDLLLLCSDGLSGMMSEAELKEAVLKAQHNPLREIARELISLANLGGGKDNITAVLIRAHGGESDATENHDVPDEDETHKTQPTQAPTS